MKVIVKGKEIEIDTDIIPNEKDYEESPIEDQKELEPTKELTEEEIDQIRKEEEHE